MEKHVFGIEKMLLIIIFAADLCYQQWDTIIPQYSIAKSHMGYRIYIYSINAKKSISYFIWSMEETLTAEEYRKKTILVGYFQLHSFY